MKAILITLLCLFSKISWSQNYTIIIIENPETTYGTISTLDDARETVKTQTVLQNRYDSNSTRIDNAIRNISSKIAALPYSSQIKSEISASFDKTLDDLNRNLKSNTRPLLSNSQTSQIINNLYSSVNSNINYLVKKHDYESKYEETRYKPNQEIGQTNNNTRPADDEVLEFMNRHGGYRVPRILEYNLVNGDWVLEKTDTGYFYYRGHELYMKRGEGKWLHRPLVFNRYSPLKKTYNYTSEYGETYIAEDFSKVIFFDSNKGSKKYEWIIGDFVGEAIPH